MASLRDAMTQVPRSVHGSSSWAEAYGREHAQLVKDYAARAPRSVQRHLGPSELGEECDRQVVAKMSASAKTNNVSDPWASVMGTAGHAYVESMYVWDNVRREGSGIYRRWIPELRVTPDPGPDPHPGTADLYDVANRALVDHKFLGDSSRQKLIAKGPKRVYYVQLLLYRRGYENLGLPVDRIVLLAWPRTKSSLDELYVWEHIPDEADERLVDQVLAQTSIRQRLATEVKSGRMSIMDVQATPSDDSCHYCLAGDTEVVTRKGIKPIRGLAGRTAELLVPGISSSGRRMRTGSFKQVPVRYFGEQPTHKVRLEDRRASKEVVTTAEHNWFVTDRSRISRSGTRVVRHQWRKTTAELRPGDLIQPLRRSGGADPGIMNVAVAQGFTFGDGTSRYNDPHERPASLSVYSNGKDDTLLRFFPDYTQYDGMKSVYGLPRFWKRLPPLDESRSFLLSWLAGYFAADGCVSEEGACELNSSRRENLEFARDLAAVCGVGYRPVTMQSRLGICAMEATNLYGLRFQRRDLPSWFFLIDEHASRAEAANEKPERETYWKVVSVEPTGRVEPVYCATVEGAGAFGLADDLMTGNCPLYRPQAAYDDRYGCPGTALRKSALQAA